MALDPSIPLSVQTPQVNPMNLLGQVMALKSAQQEQQLRGLEITGAQQKNRANAEAAEDARALTEAIRANTAEDGTIDYGKVTRHLATTGRGQSVVKWLDDVSKRNEQDYKTVQERLKAVAGAGDVAARNFQSVTDQDTWDAAKKLTKSQLESIHPGMGAVVDQLPPAFSDEAKQQAMTAGLSAKELNDHLLKLAEASRKAPGEVADADKKVRENAASRLGAATSQAEYTKTWDSLPAGIAKMFPSPESWNKETTPLHVRQVGMAPNQQAAAQYRDRLIKVDEGNLRVREAELRNRESQADAKDPAQSQDWREYVKADDDNWRNYQASVRNATRDLTAAPVYKPLGTFAQWRATKYPDGIPTPTRRPLAPDTPKPAPSHVAPKPVEKAAGKLPMADPKKVQIRVNGKLLEGTQEQIDDFLKRSGAKLK